MASKDQGIGATILVVALAVIVFYIWWLFLSPTDWSFGGWSFRELAVIIPVLIIVLAVLAIAGWIGYTMATTPPPKPLEEVPELSESGEGKEAGEKKGSAQPQAK